VLDPKIHNIIFDLGGVILNLSVESTLRKFAALSNQPLDEVVATYHARPEFLAYEKGEITSDEFRANLRKIFGLTSADTALDECWNAMLGDIPPERIDLLRELKSRYRTFLLSNTNAIHVDCFSGIVKKDHNLESLEPLFHKTYYSHLMKMRKPDPEIYEYVLNQNNLKADETIFLDDNAANLKGAASVGIQTFHVTHPDLIFSLFR
jgi:putative hydrolase of the HAD superfamily